MGIRTKGEEVGLIKRLTSIWLIIIFAMIIGIVEPVYGAQQKEYSISTEKDLRELCEMVNKLESEPWNSSLLMDFEGVTFVLKNDIQLTDKWVPIGLDNASCFNGTFDGNNYRITNMKIDEFYENSGFFGYLDGSVINLTIEGYNHANAGNCGGIVGTLSGDGYVKNCITSVNVKGKSKVGGIVGNNEGGQIDGCTNKGNIHGTHKVGGVVGENWGGSVYNCGNIGHVKSTRRGVATYGTGGVAGRSVSSDSIISNSYNLGNIDSNTEATGGIVGYVNGYGSTIKSSCNRGVVTINLKTSDAEISPAYGGGIVGTVGTKGVKISGCYNSGNVKNADNAGGIIGKYINEDKADHDELYINNNYYTFREFDTAIGSVNNKKDDNIDKAGTGISVRNLEKLVFRWQTATGNYFDDEITSIQRSNTYGEMIMELLSPDKITTKAFILYMEAQDKLKLQKEDR